MHYFHPCNRYQVNYKSRHTDERIHPLYIHHEVIMRYIYDYVIVHMTQDQSVLDKKRTFPVEESLSSKYLKRTVVYYGRNADRFMKVITHQYSEHMYCCVTVTEPSKYGLGATVSLNCTQCHNTQRHC